MKKFRIALAGIFLLCLFLAPAYTDAVSLNPIDWFKQAGQGIFNLGILFVYGMPIALITLVAFTFAFIGSTIVTALNFLLLQVIRQTLNVTLLPGGADTAGFVTQGWEVSRNIVTAILLLILVFVGFATILRLKEYDLQKILPRLALVALLINFSGFLVAVIVDLSNIVTFFFLSKVASFSFSFGAISNLAQGTFTGIINLFKDVFTTDPLSFLTAALTPAANALVLGIFFVLTAFVLFVVLILFVARVAVLWLLTILAPLAFGMSVLPGTQKYWQDWMKQLISWATVGIPMSFFLWLTALMMKNYGKIQEAVGLGDAPKATDMPGITSVVANVLPPFVILLMLGMGAMISMKTSAMGATKVIGTGKILGKVAGARLGARLWRQKIAGKSVGAHFETGGEKLRTMGQRLAANNKDNHSIFGALKRRAGNSTALTGNLLEMGAKETSTQVGIMEARQIEAAKKRAARAKTPKDAINRLKQSLLVGDMDGGIASLTQLIEGGNTVDIENALKNGEITDDQLRHVYQGAKERRDPAYHRTILKAFLNKASILEGSEEKGAVALEGIKKQIQAKDFTDKIILPSSYDPRTKEGAKIFDYILENTDPENLPAMFERVIDPEQQEAMYRAMTAKGEDWYFKNNKERILTWAASTAAADKFGISPLFGLNRNAITAKKREKGTTSGTEEELLERKDRLGQELAGLTGEDAKKRGKSIQKQMGEIDNAINLRKVHDVDLRDQRDLAAQRLNDWQEQTPQAARKQDFYQEEKRRRDAYSILQAEYERRRPDKGLFDPTNVPVAEQLVSLKKKEADIEKELMSAPPTITTLLRTLGGQVVIEPGKIKQETVDKLGNWKKQVWDLQKTKEQIKALEGLISEPKIPQQQVEAEIAALARSRQGIAAELAQTQSELETARKEASSRILGTDPKLGLDSPQFKERAQRNMERDKELRNLRARLKQSEDDLPKAQDELKKLLEAGIATPPPSLLARIQHAQQEISSVPQSIQRAEERILKKALENPELVEMALKSDSLKAAAENAPQISNLKERAQGYQTVINQRDQTLKELAQQTRDEESKRLPPTVRKVEQELRDTLPLINKLKAEIASLDTKIEREKTSYGKDAKGIEDLLFRKKHAEETLKIKEADIEEMRSAREQAWQIARATPKVDHAQRLANIRIHEKDQEEKLMKQKIAKQSAEEIKKTEDLLGTIRRERQEQERSLATLYGKGDLTDQLSKMQSQQDRFEEMLKRNEELSEDQKKDYKKFKDIEKEVRTVLKREGALKNFPEKEVRKAMQQEKEKQEKEKQEKERQEKKRRGR